MARKQKPLLEDITIEATAAEGNGLARVDGKVIFVKQGIPGDVVDVQINKVRSGYSQGFIVRMKSPSPHRLSPFCAHFGTCARTTNSWPGAARSPNFRATPCITGASLNFRGSSA